MLDLAAAVRDMDEAVLLEDGRRARECVGFVFIFGACGDSEWGRRAMDSMIA
jgi:hypothetical protein